MPSGKATTIETWADYLAMRRQGISLYGASKQCGLSSHACRDAEHGKAPRNYLAAAEALGKNAAEHIANYGAGIEDRLTGRHETASYKEFSYGVSDRGASVRIPWQVARDKKGYIEDRRPNANVDPYLATRLILDTVCGDASK